MKNGEDRSFVVSLEKENILWCFIVLFIGTYEDDIAKHSFGFTQLDIRNLGYDVYFSFALDEGNDRTELVEVFFVVSLQSR